MNRRYASIVVFLAVAAVVALGGCQRSMSKGPATPLPKPQAVPSGTLSPTQEPMSSVATSVAAEATATVAGAAAQTTPPSPLATTAPLATAAPPVATQPPAVVVATPVPSSIAVINYTVKPGDRLFSIGREFGVGPYVIAQANRLGPPYTIYPGQVLVIPKGGPPGPTPTVGPAPTTYTVQAGDTVYSIARKFGKSAAAIINANNLANPHLIFPGQVLKIP